MKNRPYEKRLLAGFVAALLTAVQLAAQGAPLPEAKPEDVGMSSQRLERVTALMKRAVDTGDIAGAVVMIARKGKLIYHYADGSQDVISAGEAYVARPGHTPEIFAGTEVIEFSPAEDLAKTVEVVMANAAKA